MGRHLRWISSTHLIRIGSFTLNTNLKQKISKLAKIILANSPNCSLDESQVREQLGEGINPFILQCERAQGDSKLVESTIQYLTYTHAFPRSKASVDTYLAMLEVIIDIALPVAVPEDTNMEFYNFLTSGIEKANLIFLKNK